MSNKGHHLNKLGSTLVPYDSISSSHSIKKKEVFKDFYHRPTWTENMEGRKGHNFVLLLYL